MIFQTEKTKEMKDSSQFVCLFSSANVAHGWVYDLLNCGMQTLQYVL